MSVSPPQGCKHLLRMNATVNMMHRLYVLPMAKPSCSQAYVFDMLALRIWRRDERENMVNEKLFSRCRFDGRRGCGHCGSASCGNGRAD